MKIHKLEKIYNFLENWNFQTENGYCRYQIFGGIETSIFTKFSGIFSSKTDLLHYYDIKTVLANNMVINPECIKVQILIDPIYDTHKVLFESQYSNLELEIIKQFKSDFEKLWSDL